jgi:hypothetical protein
MSALVLQPSLDPKEPPFGGTALFWPDSRRSRILQEPSAFPRAISQVRARIPSGAQPALVEFARDWVAIILRADQIPHSQTSVFDMPPLNLGRVLRPMTERDDLLQEMLDDTRF